VNSPATELATGAWEADEAPTLFVAVERKPVVVQVLLTQAPPEAPGYAHVSSVRYEPTGQVVTQATVSSCAPDTDAPDTRNGEIEPKRPEERCGAPPTTMGALGTDKQNLLPQEQREERKEESDACD
jgi:hypothetical protein